MNKNANGILSKQEISDGYLKFFGKNLKHEEIE
jgi:hypothetical protein